ncbi:growth hormone secretagogue receptor type 1 [Plakobranchus ocellatus]|uniref:Growth hormone secretagogue receptor type 1 n=1 Tax=Plakobranchus ocellatus TaxID=259542 RepID=A0AAV4A9Q7_9GAST|nr:growth hormone secretagogue receptor type 1 [Plakobranchus ocellatus]
MNSSNTTPGFSDLYEDDDELEPDHGFHTMVGVVPRKVYLGVIYFILIFGILGNICIICLMQYRDFRNLSYPVYLRALAVSDSLVLLTVCTEDILDHQFDLLYKFLTSSVALCKIWVYIGNVVRLLSPWLIVALTCDRFVAVVFPLRRAVLCSRRTAMIVCALITGLVVSESVFFLVLSKLISYEGESQQLCSMKDTESLTDYLHLRTLCHETTLPCFIILFLNVAIILTVRRSFKFRATAGTAGSSQPGGEKMSSMDKVTVSLTAVSMMAFCTLVPVSILQVIEWERERELLRYEETIDWHNNSSSKEQLKHLEHLEHRLQTVSDYWPPLNLLFLVNFGQNFYVMLTTGPKYRQVVGSWFQLWRCSGQRNEAQTSRETTTSKLDSRI